MKDGSATPSRAFFTNPSDCETQPPTTTFHIDSWENPAPVPAHPDGAPETEKLDFSEPQWLTASAESPPVTGCEQLRFNPALSFAPEAAHSQADEPSGYEATLPCAPE